MMGSATTVRAQPNVRCGDWPRLSAARFRDRTGVISEGQELTFGQFNSRINLVATTLRRLGIGRGDRVAILAHDSHRYLEVVFACMKLGSVYVPLSPGSTGAESTGAESTGAELRRQVALAEPTCLFFSGAYADVVNGVHVLGLKEAVCFDAVGSAGTAYERWIAGGVDEEVDTPVDDGDLGALVFTSGTTGAPKEVMHTQAFTKLGALQSVLARRLPDGAVHYSAAPLSGLPGRLHAIGGVMRGAASVLDRRSDAETVLRWLGSGRVQAAFLSPATMTALLDEPGIAEVDLSAVRSIGYGGAPMSIPVLRRAMKTLSSDFTQMFGADAEAGLQTVLTPADHRRALAGEEHLLESVGKPAFGVDLRVVDDDFQDVPFGEVGEIATRADACMAGYLDRPEETDRAVCDGWVRAGDLAREDSEHFVYLSGRRG